MEDVDDGEGYNNEADEDDNDNDIDNDNENENENDLDNDNDNDNDNEMEEEDRDQETAAEDTMDKADDVSTIDQSQSQPSAAAADLRTRDGTTSALDAAGSPGGARLSPSAAAKPSAREALMARLFAPVRPEAVTARLYDIVPTMAAPQSTSINAIAITPDLRYWLSGGSDGYIRKYDGPATINGRQLLTVAQRHPFVDSVVKAGVLMSYWENDEPSQPSARGVEEHNLSPVYSLAVHSQALWVLAGCESGGINLQSVRHDEGKRITCLQQHSNAVSVLTLAQDERSVLSGSWDKKILDWDLNTGNVKRSFDGTGGQISAIELRPVSGAPIPPEASDFSIKSDTLFSDNDRMPLANRAFSTAGTGTDGATQNNRAADDAQEAQASPSHESLFGGSDTGSLFGETVGGGFGGDDDDEFSRAMGMSLDDGSGQDGGLDHSADIAAFNSGTAAPTAQERADNQDNQESTGTSGQQEAQLPPPPGEPTAASESAPSEEKTTAAAQEPVSGQATNNSTSGAAARQSPPAASSTQPEPPRASPPPSAPPSVKEAPASPSLVLSSEVPPPQHDPTQSADIVFFSAAIDGTIRVWDRRVQNPVARIAVRPGVPPWCMGACWSPDGNWIYAGRRNGTVEEYSIHKARNGWEPERALKFPAGSGAVSAVRAMPNGRHLIWWVFPLVFFFFSFQVPLSQDRTIPF